MAAKIIDILLRLKADATGVKAIEKAIEDQTAAIEELKPAYTEAGEQAEKAATQAEKAIESQTEAVEELKPAYAEAGEQAEKAATQAEQAAEDAAAAVDEHVEAVEDLKPAYEAAGKEAKGAGGEIDKSSKKITQSGEAASSAGKKITDGLRKTTQASKDLAGSGTKLKTVGDVLRNLANLNFQGAASSMSQLGEKAKAFVGVVSAGITAVAVWVRNIQNWARASAEVEKADLAGIAKGIIEGVDAAGDSFDRFTEKVRAAADEMRAMRDAAKILNDADRELTTQKIEARRQKELSGVDDEEKRNSINEKYNAELAVLKESWSEEDASTAINQNSEDADIKRKEAKRLRERMSQNKRSIGVVTGQQNMVNEEIGDIEDQSGVKKFFADMLYRNTSQERAGEYQQQFDALGTKKMGIIAENQKLLAQIKKLESEADLMDDVVSEALGKKLTAAEYTTQAGTTARADAARRAAPAAPAAAPAARVPQIPGDPSEVRRREDLLWQMNRVGMKGASVPDSDRAQGANAAQGLIDMKFMPASAEAAVKAAKDLLEQQDSSWAEIQQALQAVTAQMRRQREDTITIKEKINNLPGGR